MALQDKVEELQRTTATLVAQMETAQKSLDKLFDSYQQVTRDVAELRREHGMALALLQREMDGCKQWQADQVKGREEFQRRLWAFGPNLFGALISGAIAAAVAYFVSRR